MQRALICACLSFGLASSLATTVVAQGNASYQPVRGVVRVDSTNVPYEARIEPTAMAAESTSIETGGDSWSARGFDLKTLIAQIYDIDVRLVDLPAGVDAAARYDLSVSLPTEVDQDSMERLLTDALDKKFGVSIKPERRAMDVYVLSAPAGPGSELHKHAFASHRNGVAKLMGSGGDVQDAGGQITYMGRDCSGVTSGGITVSGGTISEFRRTLEPDLDRVLVDETRLNGSYDFKIGAYANQGQLFQLLQAQLGIVVTPAQRTVTVLTVRPANAQNFEAQL